MRLLKKSIIADSNFLIRSLQSLPCSSFLINNYNNHTMSSNSDTADKNKAADDILKMLREAGVSTESLVEKSHAFWDTQVCDA